MADDADESGSPECLWLTRGEAARLCGMGIRHFDEAVRPRAAGAVRGSGAKLRYDAAKIVAALVEYRLAQLQASNSFDTADGGTSDSPALERGRLAKAQLLELELAERQKELIRAQAMREALRPAIAILRQVADRLIRKFGNDAGEIYNEGVDDFAAAVLRFLAADPADPEPAPEQRRDPSGPADRVGAADAAAPVDP